MLVTQFQAKMNGSLFSEAALGHFLSLQKLVELGATPDKDYKPIAEAARLGYYDCLHFLLQNSQKLNLQADPDTLGRVAFKALKNKYNKCLEVLLDYVSTCHILINNEAKFRLRAPLLKSELISTSCCENLFDSRIEF